MGSYNVIVVLILQNPIQRVGPVVKHLQPGGKGIMGGLDGGVAVVNTD